MEEALIKEIKNLLKSKFQFSRISGGQNCQKYKLEVDDGRKLFCKVGDSSTKMFFCERNGLLELKKSTVRIPNVLFTTEKFIIMEFLSPGQIAPHTFFDFGVNLGNLHKVTSKKFGYREDNFIGSNPQKNKESDSWINFFYENRLLFQFKMAESKGMINSETKKAFSSLEKKIHKIIIENESPSLIHGDLWFGNFVIDEKSNACLIDPAIYFGNREAEFGILTLFGGFNEDFYKGYNKSNPLEEDWEYRNKIYQLYHLLNHLNLFGKSYLKQVQENINFYN